MPTEDTFLIVCDVARIDGSPAAVTQTGPALSAKSPRAAYFSGAPPARDAANAAAASGIREAEHL